MPDHTPMPDDKRPWDKQPRNRGGKRDRQDDREDEEEWEEDDRPRRRRRDDDEDDYDPALKMVVPLNTSALAIVAGYIGLVSVLCLPAPFALLFGILALQHLKKNPKLDGKGRAIFALVMGSIFSLVLVIAGIATLIG
jgi:hypothetical protein